MSNRCICTVTPWSRSGGVCPRAATTADGFCDYCDDVCREGRAG